MDQLNTGENAGAAAQTDLGAMQSEAHAEQEQMVPLSALQAERRERQNLQETAKILQDHLALLQSNQPKQLMQNAKQEEFSDADLVTHGDLKKLADSFKRDTQLDTMELKMAQMYPDYNEVVRKYLPEVLKEDPELKATVLNAPNPYKLAYHLAKRSDHFLQDQRLSTRSPEAAKAAQNLQRPGNLSQIGQGVSGSAAGNYKSMSDKDFIALANKNLGYV